VLKITDMEKVRNFQVMSDKFKVVRICINGNHVQKGVNNLYNV